MVGAFWDERYGGEDYLFGTGPNDTLVEMCAGLEPGTALDLGCGEGRNSVWLAGLGHHVTGVDASSMGLDKARRLAGSAGVPVDWVHADLGVYQPERRASDLVILAYVHLHPEIRPVVHGAAASAVAHGGRLILIGHHVRNIAEGTGGPQDPTLLFDEAMLRDDFAQLSVSRCEVIRRSVPGSEVDALDIVLEATPT